LVEKLHNIRMQPQPPEAAWFSGAARVFNLAMKLVEEEDTKGQRASSFSKLYGGGYEFVLWKDGRFEKFDDFAVLVWRADLNEKQMVLRMPHLVWRQKYFENGHLVIRASRISNGIGKRAGQLVIDNELYSVPPTVKSGGRRALRGRD